MQYFTKDQIDFIARVLQSEYSTTDNNLPEIEEVTGEELLSVTKKGKSFKMAIDKLQAFILSVITPYKTKIQMFEYGQEKFKSVITKMTAKMANIDSEIDALKLQVKDLTNGVEALTRSVNALITMQSDIDSIKTDLEILKH